MSKKTFASPTNKLRSPTNLNLKDYKRDETIKIADLLSPVGTIVPATSDSPPKMARTGDKWNSKSNKALISKQPTLKSEKLFKDKKSNAEAHRNEKVKQNNFLRASINVAGKLQMDTNSAASDSKGFSNAKSQKAIKRSPKKGDQTRARSEMRNDFVSSIAAMKLEYAAQPKKKIIQRKYSKSPIEFRLNHESPYAEYLPDLYREYKPKEKKLKTNNNNVSLNNFLKKLDKAYSETMSMRSGNSRQSSRRGSKLFGRANSNNRSLKKIGTFRSDFSSSSRENTKSKNYSILSFLSRSQ